MYSFDESEETATQTYINVCAAYEQILKRLDVPFIQGKLQPVNFIVLHTFRLNSELA